MMEIAATVTIRQAGPDKAEARANLEAEGTPAAAAILAVARQVDLLSAVTAAASNTSLPQVSPHAPGVMLRGRLFFRPIAALDVRGSDDPQQARAGI